MDYGNWDVSKGPFEIDFEWPLVLVKECPLGEVRLQNIVM